jgi:hypothetical protein
MTDQRRQTNANADHEREPPSAAALFPSLEKLAPARRGHEVPFVQQLEAADCGAACLAMVLIQLTTDTARRRAV